jgi:hypothetical protein
MQISSDAMFFTFSPYDGESNINSLIYSTSVFTPQTGSTGAEATPLTHLVQSHRQIDDHISG